jgi:Trk K+ transport system NAD-binding subunit
MWMSGPDGKLLGVLESKNLQFAMLERESLLNLVLANDVAVPVQAPVRPADDLTLAMHLFDQTGYDILPVVDPNTGQVMGDLLRSDVITAYNKELATRDSLAVAVDAIGVADRIGSVELGEGYALVEYEVPAHLVGRTLRELNLRERVGVQVIFIRRGRERLMPSPDMMFQHGDVVLFAGEAEGLEEKLKKVD